MKKNCLKLNKTLQKQHITNNLINELCLIINQLVCLNPLKVLKGSRIKNSSITEYSHCEPFPCWTISLTH